uniref:Uncharacterized protein n=1 Tax=Cacopsylla melanoneura TaxID=428564 RepID=A0A8D8R5S1_9HEMI
MPNLNFRQKSGYIILSLQVVNQHALPKVELTKILQYSTSLIYKKVSKLENIYSVNFTQYIKPMTEIGRVETYLNPQTNSQRNTIEISQENQRNLKLGEHEIIVFTRSLAFLKRFKD